MRLGALLAVVAGWCIAAAPSALAQGETEGRYAMGTLLEVTLPGLEPSARREHFDAVFAEVERLEGIFSSHRPTSSLESLNRSAGRGAFPVPPELADILDLSKGYTRRTRGAFDVTVGPLIHLWIEAARANRLPGEEEIADLRRRVGAERIATGEGSASLPEGTSVDLGGIAKGYALDRVARVLAGRGVDRALLSFGESSTLALGRPEDAPHWRLLLRGPEGRFRGTVALRDQALSVSGSFGRASEIEGRRFGHVIDPRSGWPVTRPLQASVLAASGTLAEAYSTALLVLEPEEGIAILEAEEGVEGMLVAEDRILRTGGFDRATGYRSID